MINQKGNKFIVMKESPRLLIFSNNCFSTTNSNGRTLAKLLLGYPKNKLAQFFIQRARPDFEICDNYYLVTDSDVLHAFFKKGTRGARIKADQMKTEGETAEIKIKTKKRTPLTMLLREMVWKSNRWQSEDFHSWIEDFSPEAVLLQAGDNAFLLRLAMTTASKYKIPLIIYNTEGYYFKNKNYFKGSGIASIFYPWFHSQFKKEFVKTMNRASCVVYNCDLLKEDYDKHFKCPSHVIYNSSDIIAGNKHEIEDDKPIISYLGNLRVGRHESLIEIAQALKGINPNYKLDIYGKIPCDEIREAFNACNAIDYKGFLPYKDVIMVMNKSDILIHAENFSKFYREDLKYAFSTKIADCLKSGTCFFNYAPEELASTQYLIKNNAACVVTDNSKLEEMLRRLISDNELRGSFISNALQLAEKNHNSEKNGKFMMELITKVVYESITS